MNTTMPKAEKASEFPKQVSVRGIPGITATIYRQSRQKPDKEGRLQTYVSFVVGYSLKGKRKMEAHSDLSQAEEAAREAIKRIAEGKQDILELTNRDLEQYRRSKDVLAPFKMELDVAASEYADLLTILNGCGTPREAARFFVKNHAKELPRITVKDAVEKCLAQARADGKSPARMKQLEGYLNAFASDMNTEVSELGTLAQFVGNPT